MVTGNRPLDGVLVADFSMGWAGPALTQLLADHGARVVKIESCTRTDWWRMARGLFVTEPEDLDLVWERSPLFNAVNENKLGITLDLDTDDGLELARALISRADVVVENYTPRVMRNFGLDYEHVRGLNPAAIMVSMPAFGSVGPWADFKATAFATESAAGVTALSGTPDEPLLGSTAIADPNAGVVGALSVVMALRARRRTGLGQYIEVAQIEALTPLVTDALLHTQLTGAPPPRRGNRAGDHAPQGVFPAEGDDRWIAISIETDEQWAALARFLGAPGSDTPWPDRVSRLGDQDAVEAWVAAHTTSWNAHELATALQATGVPAAAVQDAADVLADPHLSARGFFTLSDRPVVGTHPYPCPPARLSRTPAVRSRPAPTLGQHNMDVLVGDLGMTPDEVRQLESDGVIGTAPKFGP